MGDDLLLQQMKAANEEWRKTPPEERFESLVRSGIIDREGKLLRHLPEPPEQRERTESHPVNSALPLPDSERSTST